MSISTPGKRKPPLWHSWRGNNAPRDIPTETERACKACGITKPLAEFRRIVIPKHNHPGYWARSCKACNTARYLARYRSSDPAILASRERYRRSRPSRRRVRGSRVEWTTVRAGVELGLSVTTIAIYCTEGKIAARKVLGEWVIDPASVRALAQERGDSPVVAEEWLTMPDAMAALGISKQRIARLCTDGRLRAVRAHDRYNAPWLIDPVSVENWRKQREG